MDHIQEVFKGYWLVALSTFGGIRIFTNAK